MDKPETASAQKAPTLAGANAELRPMGYVIRRERNGLIAMKFFGQHSCWFRSPVYSDINAALSAARTAFEARQEAARVKRAGRDARNEAARQAWEESRG